MPCTFYDSLSLLEMYNFPREMPVSASSVISGRFREVVSGVIRKFGGEKRVLYSRPATFISA